MPPHTPRQVQVQAQAQPTPQAQKNSVIVRRTANWGPSFWRFDYIQSLTSEYAVESHTERLKEFKEETRKMLIENLEGQALAQLQLVDTLQRLGVAYHFEKEIDAILTAVHNNDPGKETWKKNDLSSTALEFRLLRQHGFMVPQEALYAFKDDDSVWNPKKCLSFDDEYVMAMLNLYEASFHAKTGEIVLEDATICSTEYLREFYNSKKDNDNTNFIVELVGHALETPLYWKVRRLESLWFISAYERRNDNNPLLLKFAKLDFNILQSVHQEDLKRSSRWWKNVGLGEKMTFSRDRLVEAYLWTVGETFEPGLGYFRNMSTVLNSLITVVDDAYDVYGTLEELELFTEVVERWDVNAMDELPTYLKIIFMSLHNAINEMAYHVVKEQGIHVLKYLKKAWVDLCQRYIVEARWFNNGHIPSFNEYIEHRWMSCSAHIVITQAYFLLANPITEEALNYFENYSNFCRHAAMLCGLANDMGTSFHELERGDVQKAIQCYMHETGADEEAARDHIRGMMRESWKALNKERAAISSFLPKIYLETITNLARMTLYMYQGGSDGVGIQKSSKTKNTIYSLLINPLPLE